MQSGRYPSRKTRSQSIERFDPNAYNNDKKKSARRSKSLPPTLNDSDDECANAAPPIQEKQKTTRKMSKQVFADGDDQKETLENDDIYFMARQLYKLSNPDLQKLLARIKQKSPTGIIDNSNYQESKYSVFFTCDYNNQFPRNQSPGRVVVDMKSNGINMETLIWLWKLLFSKKTQHRKSLKYDDGCLQHICDESLTCTNLVILLRPITTAITVSGTSTLLEEGILYVRGKDIYYELTSFCVTNECHMILIKPGNAGQELVRKCTKCIITQSDESSLYLGELFLVQMSMDDRLQLLGYLLWKHDDIVLQDLGRIKEHKRFNTATIESGIVINLFELGKSAMGKIWKKLDRGITFKSKVRKEANDKVTINDQGLDNLLLPSDNTEAQQHLAAAKEQLINKDFLVVRVKQDIFGIVDLKTKKHVIGQYPSGLSGAQKSLVNSSGAQQWRFLHCSGTCMHEVMTYNVMETDGRCVKCYREGELESSADDATQKLNKHIETNLSTDQQVVAKTITSDEQYRDAAVSAMKWFMDSPHAQWKIDFLTFIKNHKTYSTMGLVDVICDKLKRQPVCIVL